MIGKPLKTTVLGTDDIECALGRIRLIATIANGRGVVPTTSMRIYGNYALVLITSGAGVYRDANGIELAVGAGDVILVFPELPHAYFPTTSESWDEAYLIFDGPAFDAWRRMGLLDTHHPVISTRSPGLWLERIVKLANIEGADTVAGKAIQICALLRMITELTSKQPVAKDMAQVPTAKSSWLMHACSLLSSELDRGYGNADFASKMGMPTESFRKRFHQELGIPPIQFRNLKRVEAATHLLQYTSMTHAEIASQLGFTDEYQFSKRFKQIRGVPPRQFRREVWAPSG